MPRTFFTIDNIDDDIYPPHHPEVIKFFDRSSAEGFLKLMNDNLNNIFSECTVAEHEIKGE